MTRTDFQTLAEMRIEEAGILLANGKFDGAYYLAGYGVEFALKSCIITMLKSSDSWQELVFSQQCYTHNLELLSRLAGLEAAINSAGPVTVNWLQVRDWKEQSRYQHGRSPLAVRQFYQAITDPTDGVLQWLKARW